MSYEVILFDMDGVLLRGAETSADVYRKAAREALRESGIDPLESNSDAVEQFHYTDKMRSTCEELGVDVAKFWKRREHHAARLENEQIREGEREPYDDIKTLKELSQSHRLGIVSNNRQSTVEEVVSVCNLEFVDPVVGRDHKLSGYYDRKPAPTLLMEATQSLGTEDAIYVGDSEKDVIAAHRAGLDSAFLRRSHNSHIDIEAPPTVEIETLNQLRCI